VIFFYLVSFFSFFSAAFASEDLVIKNRNALLISCEKKSAVFSRDIQKIYSKFKSIYKEDNWLPIWLEIICGYSSKKDFDCESVFDCVLSESDPKEKSLKILDLVNFGLLLSDFTVLERLFTLFSSCAFSRSKFGANTLEIIFNFSKKLEPLLQEKTESNLNVFFDKNYENILLNTIRHGYSDSFKVFLDFFLQRQVVLVDNNSYDPYSCNIFAVPLLEFVSGLMRKTRDTLLVYKYNQEEGALITYDPIYKILSNFNESTMKASKDLLKKDKAKYLLFKKYFSFLKVKNYLLFKIGKEYLRPLIERKNYNEFYWFCCYLRGNEELDIKSFFGFKKLFRFLNNKKIKSKKKSAIEILTSEILSR
jgi:hypothetical protein